MTGSQQLNLRHFTTIMRDGSQKPATSNKHHHGILLLDQGRVLMAIVRPSDASDGCVRVFKVTMYI